MLDRLAPWGPPLPAQGADRFCRADQSLQPCASVTLGYGSLDGPKFVQVNDCPKRRSEVVMLQWVVAGGIGLRAVKFGDLLHRMYQ